MKFQIVVDSSADIIEEYENELVRVRSVPLTINVDSKEYIDDKDLDVKELLDAMHNSKTKSTTACPSPEDFARLFAQADYTFCLTISSKLSGTYNAANLAKNMVEESGKEVCLIDSKAVSGVLKLMVSDIIKLIEEGKTFTEIKEIIKADDYHLLFILSNFDNLIKNGRMNKFTGMFASLLHIRPLFVASDGEIKLLKKVRTLTKSLEALVDEMKICEPNLDKGKVIISHCNAQEIVEELKVNIIKTYPDLEIEVVKMRGLTSFYAEEKGIIVSFKE